jgi:hypothetical protein
MRAARMILEGVVVAAFVATVCLLAVAVAG